MPIDILPVALPLTPLGDGASAPEAGLIGDKPILASMKVAGHSLVGTARSRTVRALGTLTVLSFALALTLRYATAQTLLGLAGPGGGAQSSAGLEEAGKSFSSLTLSNGAVTILGADTNLYVTTAVAFDSKSSLLYLEKDEPNGFHLVVVNSSGSESDMGLLAAVFKIFTFDPATNSLFGLAGPGGGSLSSAGLTVSGTGIWKLDLGSGAETLLSADTNQFIGTAYAFNPISSLLYLEKEENDGTHLISVDSSGNESEIALLSQVFKFFTYNAFADALIGLSGPGGGGLSSAGLTVSGTGFSGFFVTLNQPFTLTGDTSLYVGTAFAFNPATSLLYLERQQTDGFHLVSVSSLGVITDVGLLSSTFKLFAPGRDLAKTLGGCPCAGQVSVANPIDIGSGNEWEHVVDYTTTGQNPLAFQRYYNSMANAAGGVPTYASTLGTNWRSTYDRYLHVSSSTVVAERADGQQLTFTLSAGAWMSDSDVDVTLTQSGSTWTLTDRNDTIETYSVASSGKGFLSTITARNGYQQILTYNTSNLLTSVTDSYSRSLNFTYNSVGLLQTVTTPDTLVLTYAMTAVTGGNQLTTVSYNTNPATSQIYLYQNSAFPFSLTGITDEDGNRFGTWTYDSSGRATSSQLGAGADLTNLTYNSDGTTTVVNALGVTDTYTFTTLQGVPKVTQISRAATPTTAAATETFGYDGNGYQASKTDWNGNQTTYVNDSHGDPTTIDEAVGTSAARTTTIAYDKTWVHLPATVTTSGLTTAYSYDDDGEVLTRTLTDTTTGTLPYSTNGQARMWTNTWSNALLASVQTPNGNTTKYGYDSSGALTSTTDAKGHVTTITSHTGGGLPLTIVDPNGVTTTLTYDPRLRLTGSTVSGPAGTYPTTWTYDPVGNLVTTTLPDNSSLTNSYDTAHRLTKVLNSIGHYIVYTLDALGDRTQTNIYDAGGNIQWQRSGSFDALGRLLVDTAGAGQTTTRTYDPIGNTLTIVDGLGHTTTDTYDGLNRLSGSTEANGGVTTPAYDTHDRIVSVTDANGNTTSYTRDGFGDVIQQVSPDSGTTLYRYDGDANLTAKTDALGIVTNQTFDSLDRPLTTSYPADAAENVTYTYDQTGSGFAFGIGRLTSVTDAAGSLTRQYEERGNLANETRVNGKTKLSTSYTYDGASRIATMTYPDGSVVMYQRDEAGYIDQVSAQLPGSSSSTPIANVVVHLPFGPINLLEFGNGAQNVWHTDQDYRVTEISEIISSGHYLQDPVYAYDVANNVMSITDHVNPSSSQMLGYDNINRLTSATSGTGGYGSFSWTYDKIGNRLTQVQGTTTTTYGYALGTNRLASITTGPARRASLRMPHKWNRSRVAFYLSAHIVPPPLASRARDRSQTLNQRPRSLLSSLAGWPMLLAGITGIFCFRRRLRDSRLLLVLCMVALLTGSTTLITSCSKGTSGASTPTNPTPPPAAAQPAFSPAAGTYTSAQSVTLSDSTTGAAIYYTTDGTTPTANSTKYSGPIPISSTETVQAIATASGYTNSAVASATYTINLTLSGTVSVVTNANGNITSIPPANSTASATFSYNNANRLASVVGSPMAASFVYDWAGQRFSKTDTGTPPTIYSYAQGGTLIAENDNGSVTDYIYADGRPIAVLQPGASTAGDQVNYVHTDRLGTPQVVTNSSGSTVWSTTYQPFGTTGVLNAAINQNLRFPGQNFDAETGFNYNLNRDYVPYLGRYLESDPIGLASGANPYQYAQQNPVSLFDPTGLKTLVIVSGPVGDNPAGHVAIAFTGEGVFSYGTKEPFGYDTTAYLMGQLANRYVDLYLLDTTPEQDQQMINYLMANYTQGKYSATQHNCATAVNGALDAAGIKGDLYAAIAEGGALLPQLPQSTSDIVTSFPGVQAVHISQAASPPFDLSSFNPNTRR